MTSPAPQKSEWSPSDCASCVRNTGQAVRCEVSFSKSVPTIGTPFSRAARAAGRLTYLPRRIPCTSAKESRIAENSFSLKRASSDTAACCCDSAYRPCRAIKDIMAPRLARGGCDGWRFGRRLLSPWRVRAQGRYPTLPVRLPGLFFHDCVDRLRATERLGRIGRTR